MALNMSEMWSNGVTMAFFSKKVQKLAKRMGVRPQTPSVIRLSYVSLLNTSFTLDIFAV